MVFFSATSLSACGSGGDQAASSSPEPTPPAKQLVARLSDLSRGYSVYESGLETIGDALDALGDVTPDVTERVRREWAGAYNVAFTGPNPAVVCEAVVYRSTEGATNLFGLEIERLPDSSKLTATRSRQQTSTLSWATKPPRSPRSPVALSSSGVIAT